MFSTTPCPFHPRGSTNLPLYVFSTPRGHPLPFSFLATLLHRPSRCATNALVRPPVLRSLSLSLPPSLSLFLFALRLVVQHTLFNQPPLHCPPYVHERSLFLVSFSIYSYIWCRVLGYFHTFAAFEKNINNIGMCIPISFDPMSRNKEGKKIIFLFPNVLRIYVFWCALLSIDNV